MCPCRTRNPQAHKTRDDSWGERLPQSPSPFTSRAWLAYGGHNVRKGDRFSFRLTTRGTDGPLPTFRWTFLAGQVVPSPAGEFIASNVTSKPKQGADEDRAVDVCGPSGRAPTCSTHLFSKCSAICTVNNRDWARMVTVAKSEGERKDSVPSLTPPSESQCPACPEFCLVWFSFYYNLSWQLAAPLSEVHSPWAGAPREKLYGNEGEEVRHQY